MPDEDAVRIVARNLEYWQDLLQESRWIPPQDDDPYFDPDFDYGYDPYFYPPHYAERDEELERLWGRALQEVAGSEAQDLRILDEAGLLLESLDGLNVTGIRTDLGRIIYSTFQFKRERYLPTYIPWCFERRNGSHDRDSSVRPDLEARVVNIFADAARWEPTNVQCLGCRGGFYKATFRSGFEVEARTSDHREPIIRIKRLYTCQFCGIFVTTGRSEEEWEETMSFDLGGPTYFLYDCASWDEYYSLVRALDPIPDAGGRFDGGFKRGATPTA